MPFILNWHFPLPFSSLYPLWLSSALHGLIYYCFCEIVCPSCLTLGFLAFSWRWSNPSEKQNWTSHSIQTSFFFYPLFSCWLFMLLCCILCTKNRIQCEENSILMINYIFKPKIKEILDWEWKENQCTAMQHISSSITFYICVCVFLFVFLLTFLYKILYVLRLSKAFIDIKTSRHLSAASNLWRF